MKLLFLSGQWLQQHQDVPQRGHLTLQIGDINEPQTHLKKSLHSIQNIPSIAPHGMSSSLSAGKSSQLWEESDHAPVQEYRPQGLRNLTSLY